MPKGQREQIRILLEQVFKANERTQSLLVATQAFFVTPIIKTMESDTTAKQIFTDGLRIVEQEGYEYWMENTYPTIDSKVRDEYQRIMYLQEAINTYEFLYHYLLHFRNELA